MLHVFSVFLCAVAKRRSAARSRGADLGAAEFRVLARFRLDSERSSSRGDRPKAVFRPLNRHAILDYLGAEASSLADRLYIHDEIDSTSLWLRRKMVHAGLLSGSVCVAEMQTAGRGQHGRSWVATPYSNIMLSVAWHFGAEIHGLSLAAGVAVARALRDCGVSGVGLKWPNDVMWQGKKLAGLLVESHNNAHGRTLAILGIGVNAYLAERDADLIEQPWIDLTHILGEDIDRNRVIALLVGHVYRAFRAFEASGFERFQQEWENFHIFAGQRVRLLRGEFAINGRVLGVDAKGALQIVDENGAERIFHWGEISMRLEK